MNFDDYEHLPTPSAATNMMAGAAAGVLEHCVMYPMDSIKTRMQSLLPTFSGQTLVSTFKNMVQQEGLGRPFRGIGVVVAGAGPAHAFYFATYEYSKETLSKLYPQNNQLTYICSAVFATLIHDAISNPAEVVKQRLQMYNSPYKTVLQCAGGVYKLEGMRAFYRSYGTQLMMNLPHQALHFTTYEFFQNLLNKERKYNPAVHIIAGGAAGALASACTTPLDVTKTLLNTQETGIGLTKGMKEAMLQIYRMAGPLGFFKGLGARVLYSAPATAICWSTYEFFKFMLSERSYEEYRSTVSVVASPVTKSPDVAIKPNDPSKADISDGYVIPKRKLIRENQIGGPLALQANNVETANSTPVAGTTKLLPPPQLPSISGTGVYDALSYNTVHTDKIYDRKSGGGCNT